MFSSFKRARMECKWRADRLCVGLIGWVRAITPGWPRESPDNRSCPALGGLLSPEELKRWTADLPPSLGSLGRGKLKARVRRAGNSSVIATGAVRRHECRRCCSQRLCYVPELATLPRGINFQKEGLRTWGTGFLLGGGCLICE